MDFIIVSHSARENQNSARKGKTKAAAEVSNDRRPTECGKLHYLLS